MKYRDLIKLLEPIADEEINMTTSSVRDFAYGGGRKTVNAVRFFHQGLDGEFVVGVKQEYDSETFENIGETELITE